MILMYGNTEGKRYMSKVDFDLYSDYLTWKSDMKKYFELGSNHGEWTNPKGLQNSYLYYNVDLQDDERDRLCVMLPLIKLQIEKLGLTEELLEELEIYYREFNKGRFDELFEDFELQQIKEDILWCYEHRRDNLYKT